MFWWFWQCFHIIIGIGFVSNLGTKISCRFAFCNISCWRQASANSVPTSFIFSPFIWWPLKVCSFDSISIKILEDKLSRPHIIWYLDILAKKTFPLCHLNIQWKIHNALHCLKLSRDFLASNTWLKTCGHTIVTRFFSNGVSTLGTLSNCGHLPFKTTVKWG